MITRDILPTLADTSHAYNAEHLYVLESLATFKSICLMADIPSFEPLTAQLFSSFFDQLSALKPSDSISQSLEMHMTAILVTMVDEAPNLPTEVVDMIMAQFLCLDPRAIAGITGKGQRHGAVVDDRQSTLELKAFPTAYNVARNICNSVPDKMGAHVVQYFSDIIVDASEAANKGSNRRRMSDDGSDGILQPSDEDLKELQKAHLLLRELWRACPTVLQNLIPQLEAELSMENIQLRLLATETFADMICGIGSAGLPIRSMIDPVVYPPIMLSDPPQSLPQNPVTKPSSPQSFSSTYVTAYNSFLSRKNDKNFLIRCAWAKGVGNILRTSAGGSGLSSSEEQRLVIDLSKTLCDADERVRLAAVKVVSAFNFHDVINKLGSSGGVSDADSFLATLTDRARDKKHAVRAEAMKVLGCIWAAAVGELLAGNEEVLSKVGAIPSKVLGGYYANDPEINLLIDNVLFEQLLPLGYPATKAKASKLVSSDARKTNGAHAAVENEAETEKEDPNQVRAARILLLVGGLDEKACLVFFSSIQQRQTRLSQYAEMYIQRCEAYNGGITEGDEKPVKDHLSRLITEIAKQYPEPGNVSAHLWRFAKLHNRRCYKLMQYCMASESDYQTVVRAIREFKRCIESAVSGSKDMLETFLPLLYRISIIVYNKSHVPAVMNISKSDEYGFGETAHRVLLEISTKNPSVLKAHVKELCKYLQDSAPVSASSKPSPVTIVGDLKACSSFAKKFAEEFPKDRKFTQAMQGFALYGSPECAKHAVSILMTSSDKKELAAHNLIKKCIEKFAYGGPGFLARLATVSQLLLLAPYAITDQEKDEIVEIALGQVLQKVRTQASKSGEDNYVYILPMDEECTAKCLALKILASCVRSQDNEETLEEAAKVPYNIMHRLIINDGTLSTSDTTPGKHRPHLRLMAARLFLKCCTKKLQDQSLTPEQFGDLALVAQDPELPVRSRFLARLRKYLSQGKLPQRFYAIPFLLAFEPNEHLRAETATWLRSRAAYFSTGNYRSSNGKSSGKAAVVLESGFARLLSLLAHHPDFRNEPEDLVEFSRYIAFHLSIVANSDNLSLIYHIAQRVKQSCDALAASSTDNTIYVLSDLAQLTIRRFEDLQGYTINTLPTRIKLPITLYKDIAEHEEAQAIADKSFLPEDEDFEDRVERVVRDMLRKPSDKRGGKKRKSEGDAGGTTKKPRTGALPIRPSSSTTTIKKVNGTAKRATSSKIAKTPRPSKKKTTAATTNGDAPSSENRRRSGRVNIAGKSYAEDNEDDDEVDDDEIIWRYESENGNGKEVMQAEVAAPPVIDDDDDDNDNDNDETSEGRNQSSGLSEVDDSGGDQLPNGKKHHGDNNMDVDDKNVDDNHGSKNGTATNQLLSEAKSSAGGSGEDFDLPPSPSPPGSSVKKPASALKRSSLGKGKGKGKQQARKPSSSPSPPTPAPTRKGGHKERTKSSNHVMANTRARKRAKAKA